MLSGEKKHLPVQEIQETGSSLGWEHVPWSEDPLGQEDPLVAGRSWVSRRSLRAHGNTPTILAWRPATDRGTGAPTVIGHKKPGQ